MRAAFFLAEIFEVAQRRGDAIYANPFSHYLRHCRKTANANDFSNNIEKKEPSKIQNYI